MNNWDFVIQVDEPAPEQRPEQVLKTPEANKALQNAYDWAVAKASTSSYANAAKVYIEAIEMNREYDASPDKADYTQLLYIISNLTYWKGDIAKHSKQVLKDYSESIK